jgi:hypothetical protein
MSALSTKTTAPRTNRFRPEVQALEDRQMLSVTSIFSGGVLRLEGNGDRDFISLRNDGNGVVTGTGTGGGKSININQSGVNRLEISTKGGSDTVFITQTGNLVRDFTSDVRLGDGVDVFSMTLLGDINSFRTLSLRVRGEDSGDRITVAADRDADIQTGARLLLNLEGGSGNDTMACFYRGELDGTLDVDLTSNSGEDILTTQLGLDAGSTGRIDSSLMKAESGDDRLTYLVSDFSGVTIDAGMDGGSDFASGGKDVGTHTTNVRASRLETNKVVNFQ